MARRKKPLSAEDAALWRHVTRDVASLPGRRRTKAKAETSAADAFAPPSSNSPPAARDQADAPPRQGRKLSPNRALPPLLTPLETKERRQLTRGRRRIDARLDLHGMRQGQAHAALRGFLQHCHERGQTTAMVITGKGRGDGPLGEERGVLRRLVPQWLAEPDLRSIVLGFEEAGVRHGGAGALYVRLRKRK